LAPNHSNTRDLFILCEICETCPLVPRNTKDLFILCVICETCPLVPRSGRRVCDTKDLFILCVICVICGPEMGDKTLLSFVILTWNSERTIGDCLKGISDKCIHEGIEYEVCIVDNGSRDSTVKIIEYGFKDLPINLIRLNANKGTTVSGNIALKRCRGDVLCILDSDSILQEGRIREIISLLEDRSIGIVAPKLILPDGTTQNSAKKFPSVLTKLLKIPGIILKTGTRNRDFYGNFPFSFETEVDSAISACWFLKRELLDEVGFFDERFFYGPGDVDYCLRIKKEGKKIVYFPSFTILHHTRQITHKRPLSKIALIHFWGLIYYFFKHRYIIRPEV